MKRMIKKMLGSLGYEIRAASYAVSAIGSRTAEPNIQDSEHAALQIINMIRPYTMVTLYPLLTLFQQVCFSEKYSIPGSFVECGVWKGGAVGLMALANLKYGKERRHIHLFDSFQEICEPDSSVDGERAISEVKQYCKEAGFSGRLRPLRGFYDHKGGPGTLRENRELLESKIGYPSDFLHFHEGWFQDTLPRDAKSLGEIAILRLDGDLYASTKVCLEYLYDRVVSGGFVIVDDYGTYDGCRKAVDEFLGCLPSPVFLHYVNQDCRYWIKS
jgi:O-methyltransferase